jgi:hypothetical protein
MMHLVFQEEPEARGRQGRPPVAIEPGRSHADQTALNLAKR